MIRNYWCWHLKEWCVLFVKSVVLFWCCPQVILLAMAQYSLPPRIVWKTVITSAKYYHTTTFYKHGAHKIITILFHLSVSLLVLLPVLTQDVVKALQHHLQHSTSFFFYSQSLGSLFNRSELNFYFRHSYCILTLFYCHFIHFYYFLLSCFYHIHLFSYLVFKHMFCVCVLCYTMNLEEQHFSPLYACAYCGMITKILEILTLVLVYQIVSLTKSFYICHRCILLHNDNCERYWDDLIRTSAKFYFS